MSDVRPLHAILAAMQDGAASLVEIQRLTALSADVVRAGVDHLVRRGEIDVKMLAAGCPMGGCGSCASGINGAPGCGAIAPTEQREGPVLLALTVKKR